MAFQSIQDMSISVCLPVFECLEHGTQEVGGGSGPGVDGFLRQTFGVTRGVDGGVSGLGGVRVRRSLRINRIHRGSIVRRAMSVRHRRLVSLRGAFESFPLGQAFMGKGVDFRRFQPRPTLLHFLRRLKLHGQKRRKRWENDRFPKTSKHSCFDGYFQSVANKYGRLTISIRMMCPMRETGKCIVW